MGHNRGNKHQAIVGEERRHEYFRVWRQGGKSYEQVGKECGGVTKQAVQQGIKKVLEEMRETFSHEVDEWRAEQISRILGMLDTAGTRYEEGITDEGNLAARLLRDLANLTGTHAAQKHEHSAPGGAPLGIIVEVVNGTERTTTDQDQDQ